MSAAPHGPASAPARPPALAKRTLDLLLALAGLVLLSPLLVGIALLIKLDDGGPVFFRQTRIGARGRTFRIWKFRTMVPDAESAGAQLTVAADPRITRIGRRLRRYKMDEIPQLLNVVRGEMSLVGPRPEVPRYVARYTPRQRGVLALLPGITDPASIRFYDENERLAVAEDPEAVYVREIMPEKLRLNLEYAARATVWSDVGVILRTLGRCLRGGAARSPGLRPGPSSPPGPPPRSAPAARPRSLPPRDESPSSPS